MQLFNSFLNNEDNGMIKNNYFYQKTLNDKIYIQPWDMEFSFGLSYAGNIKYNVEKTLYDYNEIIFDIKHSSDKINKLLAERYLSLRKSVLSAEYLDAALDKYKEILCNGAGSRDASIWLGQNITADIEEVRTWLHNRTRVYDNYIRGL